MCWICDPIGETSKTLAHVADVVQNDPTANAVVTAGALAAGAYFAAPLFASSAAATTAAEIGATSAASGSAALVPLEAAASWSWGPVASVTAGAPAAASAATGAGLWGTLSTAGGYAMKGLDVAGKVTGGLNALSLVASKPAPASQFGGSVKSIVPVYGGVSAPGAGASQTTKTSGIVTAGSIGAGESVKAKDSTLTILASGLTVAAILYQFWKGH